MVNTMNEINGTKENLFNDNNLRDKICNPAVNDAKKGKYIYNIYGHEFI
jgi:hypothetical protein